MNTSENLSLELKDGDLQIADPKQILKECIVFFTFPKSRSANFPIALSLAQAATVYGEQDILGRKLYWAGFTKSINDLKKAAELLRLAGTWVGSMAKINGCKVTKPFSAYLTISCYLEGLQCSSQPAHCYKLIDDPFHPDYEPMSKTVKKKQQHYLHSSNAIVFDTEVKQYTFPCKRMLEFSMFHPQFTFEKAHHIQPQDQIQAAAVEYGVSICPFFNAAAFVQTGTRSIEAEHPLYSEVKLSYEP